MLGYIFHYMGTGSLSPLGVAEALSEGYSATQLRPSIQVKGRTISIVRSFSVGV